jgi:hypothetical protein
MDEIPIFQVKPTRVKGVLELGYIPLTKPAYSYYIPSSQRTYLNAVKADVNLLNLAKFLNWKYRDTSYLSLDGHNKDTVYNWHSDWENSKNGNEIMIMISLGELGTEFIDDELNTLIGKPNTIYLMSSGQLHRAPFEAKNKPRAVHTLVKL